MQITDEIFYREWNKKAFSRLDSSAVMGVFPALKILAKRPEVCKFCHSFSEDALDFNLSQIEDSLMVQAFPKMKRELMFPGMRLPEKDSSYLDSVSKRILNFTFADNKKLSDTSPWQDRSGIEQDISRNLPKDFKNLLNNLASRYGLRYLSIPILFNVTIDTELGKSGGFYFEALWTLWDARYGELLFLVYSKYTAKTTSSIAPEKEWARPFAYRLNIMLTKDLENLENH